MSLAPLVFLALIVSVLLAFGIAEALIHRRVLRAIPLRIHVNGTRGKSSVTRLIAAGLRAGGLRTFAKTTGTAPRVISADGKDHVIHRLRSASIGEQVRLLRYFAGEKPDAVVMECMAVQPQYQWISEQEMIRAHIGVITNVRPDHLEVMGPTLEDVARSLGNTIPFQGTLVTTQEDQQPVLKAIARKRKTQVIIADEEAVSEEELHSFTYLEHAQNVALSLAVCEAAGVTREVALEGMRQVKPDLGALVARDIDLGNGPLLFVNGMAANDPISTLHIWNFVAQRYPYGGGTCVFLNTREDRPNRTRQLAQLVFQTLKPNHLVIRGDKVSGIIKQQKKHAPEVDVTIVPMDKPLANLMAIFRQLPQETLLFAMGNQVGFGQTVVDRLMEYQLHG